MSSLFLGQDTVQVVVAAAPQCLVSVRSAATWSHVWIPF